MRKQPTYADVARRAGVSLTTVSFVLNDRTDVVITPETRERVQLAARELGYRPNSLARSLVRGKSQTIGVIVPRLDSSFCAHILQGIQDTCEEHDYRVLLSNTRHIPEKEARQVELLLEHRIDGIICVTDEWTIDRITDWLDELVSDRFPCIIVDDRTHGNRVNCVVSDDDDGGRQAVEHLIKLGHTRIAHLSAGERTSAGRDRTAGYRTAMQNAGLDSESYVVVGPGFELGDWADCMRTLLDRSDPPTAVFAANDWVGARVVHTVLERGMRVPEDIALVAYGDTDVARFLRLTSVNQDPIGMGSVAVQRLLHILDQTNVTPEVTTIPTKLVVRHSCGAAK